MIVLLCTIDDVSSVKSSKYSFFSAIPELLLLFISSYNFWFKYNFLFIYLWVFFIVLLYTWICFFTHSILKEDAYLNVCIVYDWWGVVGRQLSPMITFFYTRERKTCWVDIFWLGFIVIITFELFLLFHWNLFLLITRLFMCRCANYTSVEWMDRWIAGRHRSRSWTATPSRKWRRNRSIPSTDITPTHSAPGRKNSTLNGELALQVSQVNSIFLL